MTERGVASKAELSVGVDDKKCLCDRPSQVLMT